MADPSRPFDAFVAAHAEGLLRTAYLMTADEQEAEDLVQECLLRLAPRWGRIGRMDHPLAYARRVLVNLAVRGSTGRARRHGELHPVALDRLITSPPDDLLADRSELWAALGQLTARQRAVLVLRYFHDLSEVQVAEMLGVTTSTVSSTTARSLAQLRGLIPHVPSQTRSNGR
jgi:RNA polymerase sigma-70 factor (sigma-E family)